MARKKKKTSSSPGKTSHAHWRSILSILLMATGVMMFLAQFSYMLYWHADQSEVDWQRSAEPVKNWLGKLGNWWGDLSVFRGPGWASLFLPAAVFLGGWYWFHKKPLKPYGRSLFHFIVYILLASVGLALLLPFKPLAGGLAGYQMAAWLQHYTGRVGAYILWLLALVLWLIYLFKWEPEQIKKAASVKPRVKMPFSFKNRKKEPEDSGPETGTDETLPDKSTHIILPDEEEETTAGDEEESFFQEAEEPTSAPEPEEDPIPEIQVGQGDATIDAATLVEQQGEFDPTLDLHDYRYPTLDLLKDYDDTEIVINKEEVYEKRDIIVQTLEDFKVKVKVKSVTIGPTVTLYEVVPARGIPISKIKAREDDLAMNLQAEGIRIIAPMPGRGTVGIEVPNKNPLIVPLKDVLKSQKFRDNKMALPIALGKTIDNSTFVFDLAKAPHVLMAGATGQGKSVGLNVIINSLLFKKHPSEIKFVMIDPKKVELSLYNKIEKHFLAKLPDAEEAIVNEVENAKDVLNSVLKEMYMRYELLKSANVRKFKEYNDRFKARRLNPEKGHRYLPYIIVVIDEFADLIMATGKEVEIPITKLAQMARAVGIHLIIATQRPSVNVITGTIKANFPTRIAFRVTAKVDSRTIIDQSGAEKLIGRGDMLITSGSDLTRLQCAFIDTDEVENVVEFIGEQPGYPSALLLPEPDREENELGGLSENERDELFCEAAEIVVSTQQGSTSMLQRKLQIGYNRAGRIMDQLQQAGIVGPAKGSKPREVHVSMLDDLRELGC